jgi:hypothetical protein
MVGGSRKIREPHENSIHFYLFQLSCTQAFFVDDCPPIKREYSDSCFAEVVVGRVVMAWRGKNAKNSLKGKTFELVLNF